MKNRYIPMQTPFFYMKSGFKGVNCFHDVCFESVTSTRNHAITLCASLCAYPVDNKVFDL